MLLTKEKRIKTTMRYHFAPVRLARSKNQKTSSADEDVKKLEALRTTGWSAKWCGHYGKHYGGSSED